MTKRVATSRNAAGECRPLVASALYAFEQKVSVGHFVVSRGSVGFGDTDPAKSGDLIAVHCGFRRFQSRAIYSQNNMHSDKHKHERFMGVGGHYVVSAYAPVMFGPAPVLVFRQPGRDRRALLGAPLGSDRSSARLTARSRQVIFNASCLLATGTLLTTDPDRIILKRVVLTGVPYKISKKTAVVCVQRLPCCRPNR